MRACPNGCGCPRCAPAVEQVVLRSMIGSSVAAQIITSKFCDALPFYRQEKMFARDRIEISRQTMGRIAIAVAQRCAPLMQLVDQMLLECPVWGTDETRVRRNFRDVLKSDSRNARAREAIAFIQKLYEVERTYADSTPEQRLAARQSESAPIMERFRAWLFEASSVVTPQSMLGKAIGYAINRLPALEVYLSHPLVPIVNNRVENTIRGFAVGRGNWLFADQAHGAEASAVLYSIIETARANRIEPMHYLHFLLNCMEHFSPAEMPWQNLMPTPAIRSYAATIGIPWQMT